MRQKGYTAEDYNRRSIAHYYLERTEHPVHVFTPQSMDNREFFAKKSKVVSNLNSIVEGSIQAANNDDHVQFKICISALQQLGELHNLRGIEDLTIRLKEYMVEKPKGLGFYYRFAA